MEGPAYILELPSATGVLYAVVCDDHKQLCFQEAANTMQEALQLDEVGAAIERKDGQLDDGENAWPSGLIDALRSVDDAASAPWRLFTMATVKLGPHSGMQAIGIGSNQNKLKRASNLALAFTAVRATPHNRPALQSLASTPVKRPVDVSEQSCQSKDRGSKVVHVIAEADTNSTLKNFPVAKTPVSQAFDDWLSADSPLDCAKQRLIEFRQCRPHAGPDFNRMIKSWLNGNELVCDWSDSAPHVLEDLRTVLQLEGQHWISCWQKWEAPFNDARGFHFGKGNKRQINHRWYFGRDEPLIKDPSSTGYQADEKTYQTLPPSCQEKLVTPQRSPPENLTHSPIAKPAGSPPPKGSPPPPPPKGSPPPPKGSPPPPPPKGSAPHPKDQHSVVDQLVATHGPRAPPACAVPNSTLVSQKAPSSTDSSQCESISAREFQEAESHKYLLQGLNRSEANEGLTIGTLTSADTIPLGTDLDPQNQYNNLWAASQIQDPNGKLLVQYNLCCRVIDGENVGFSYGKEVLGRQKPFYDMEGIKRAVQHFQTRGIDVIVVSKRQEIFQCAFPDGVQIVIAERTDDIMVLKQAYSRNCPIVSRDGFDDWKTDMRVSNELRQWQLASKDLQVRFSWGTRGEFVPDFDHPTPVVRPGSRESQGQVCAVCFQYQTDDIWPAQHNGKQQWYCKDCWNQWQKDR